MPLFSPTPSLVHVLIHVIIHDKDTGVDSQPPKWTTGFISFSPYNNSKGGREGLALLTGFIKEVTEAGRLGKLEFEPRHPPSQSLSLAAQPE